MYEIHADPERALIGSMRTSGRVVVSAAAIMVAVFLTFALSGPLAPKEMGAVAVDAAIIRLLLLPVSSVLAGTGSGDDRTGSGECFPMFISATNPGSGRRYRLEYAKVLTDRKR